MKKLSKVARNYLLPLTLLAATMANGTDVYETKGKDGAPSFSDQAAPGAKRVEIGPTNSADEINIPVVESKPEKRPVEPENNNSQSEIVDYGHNSVYYDDRRRDAAVSPEARLKARKKVAEHKQGNNPSGKPGLQNPVHVTRPAAGHVRQGVHK